MTAQNLDNTGTEQVHMHTQFQIEDHVFSPTPKALQLYENSPSHKSVVIQ